ncbi:MAG: GNAT family N-acetyltransferase [Actinomycetota bacterium]
MNSSADVTVRKLPPERAAEAGRLLATSHAGYPVFRSLLPNPRTRQRLLCRFMGAAARDAASHAHALMALNGDAIVGVALWMSPGTFPLSGGRKARMAPALSASFAMAPRAMAALALAGSELETAHEPGPCWYLEALGVHPDLQGCGIGRQLMLPPLRLADTEEIPCHLHTSDPQNIAYYERFGFHTVDTATVVVGDEIRYYGMTRRPEEAVAADGSLPQI